MLRLPLTASSHAATACFHMVLLMPPTKLKWLSPLSYLPPDFRTSPKDREQSTRHQHYHQPYNHAVQTRSIECDPEASRLPSKTTQCGYHRIENAITSDILQSALAGSGYRNLQSRNAVVDGTMPVIDRTVEERMVNAATARARKKVTVSELIASYHIPLDSRGMLLIERRRESPSLVRTLQHQRQSQSL